VSRCSRRWKGGIDDRRRAGQAAAYSHAQPVIVRLSIASTEAAVSRRVMAETLLLEHGTTRRTGSRGAEARHGHRDGGERPFHGASLHASGAPG
jgi:hypothetical protein